MDDLRLLIEELNKLPKGYISEKKINGKIYYYYQYTEKGKLLSKYIKKNELADIKKQIARRKEIETKIKQIENSGRNVKKPSKRSIELTGDLMMEDSVVASFENGVMIECDLEKCPLLIKRTGNIRSFLATRAIDRSRTHSRLLKKYLGISESDDAIVSTYSFGACITDNYWFRAKGSKLKYKDISFEYDFYGDLVLKGDAGYVPKFPKHSPQLTLTGSYEKCWKLIQGEWYLYKQGTQDEIFSELFCSRLAKVLNIPTADYEYIDGYIRTKNIADKYNLEPVSSIAGDNDDYDNVFSALSTISNVIAKQYLNLILFDFIIYNVDRHNENCALLRDKKNGKIISLAPNYDNNIALLNATSNLHFNSQRDGLSKYLRNFLKQNSKAKKMVGSLNFKKITREDIQKIFDSIEIKRDENLIAEYVLDRYNFVIELCKQCKDS